ncbi:MAG: outer membrane protein transport protein [Anaeromyxobacter sp.]
MRRIGTTLMVMALLAAAPAHATNGTRVIGFGPAQSAMGGVGVGFTTDGNALASNPAGITELGQRLDLSVGWLAADVEHQATGTPTGGAPPSLFTHDGQTVASTRGGSPIPALAFVSPVGRNFSAGVGLFCISGLGVEYPENIYLSKAKTDYLVARLAPGLAYRFGDQLSVGVAVNVMMAQLVYDIAGNLPPEMGGQVKHSTATSWGYGATLGVKFTPVKMLSIGAAYETKGYFQDFSFDVPGGTDELTFDQPQLATLGASLRPFDSLVIAADLQWIDWSDTMGKGLPAYSQRQPTTMPWDLNWEDQWVLKAGAQLTVLRGLDLRVGYNHGKMPLDPSRAFENLVFPAVTEDHYTVGVGWAVTDALSLQASAIYSPEARISGANAGPPPGQMIASYSTSMSQLQVDGGVSYRF